LDFKNSQARCSECGRTYKQLGKENIICCEGEENDNTTN
jgi:hypothetical protein